MRRTDLDALFRRERARFARAYPRVAGARLVVVARYCPARSTRVRCATRDLALADLGTGVIELARRALRMPLPNLRGLLRHELGHLADPTPSRTGAEQRADDLAAAVSGVKIRYDARDVQTTARTGRWPRPRYLHR